MQAMVAGTLRYLLPGVTILTACAAGGHPAPIRAGSAVAVPEAAANQYSCGRWRFAAPPAGPALLDTQPLPSDTGMSAQALAVAVRAAGGRVVHIFALPRVRAEMDVERAVALTGELTLVRDPRRFDVPLAVGLHAPLSPKDSARLAARGARLHPPSPLGHIWVATGVGPDSLIPLLRQMPKVRGLSLFLQSCMLSRAAASRE